MEELIGRFQVWGFWNIHSLRPNRKTRKQRDIAHEHASARVDKPLLLSLIVPLQQTRVVGGEGGMSKINEASGSMQSLA